ncbi:META domain-containing protein [Niabella terrae]
MRQLLFYSVFVLMVLPGCSSPSQSSGTGKGIVGTGDVIVPRVEAKSFQKELAGTWNILSMRRQQKAELENLNGVQLVFQDTSTRFTGKAPCNRIFGNLQLKGYSIRFTDIGATRMACDNMEQETAFLDLLENRISAFTIEGNRLLLRDGISNIVMEGQRVL